MTSRRNEEIGHEVRRIADEIDRLDPSRAPVFTGFSHSGQVGEPVKGLFQGGVVLGYEASLEHVKRLLAEVRQAIGQREVGNEPNSPGAVSIDRHRRRVEWSGNAAAWGRHGGMDAG